MGLFSSIARVVGGPIVNTILGSSSSKKAIGKANAATQLGITNAKGDLNSQLATTTANLSPWITGGQQAFGQEGDILGLHGADAQSGILSSLQNSPLFQSLMRNGQDILLNNASATGGLRGGNLQHGLANFSADTLAQVIQQQLSNLGGLSTQGLGAATNLGQFGANNASQLAGLDTGSGQANAGAILGKNAVSNNMFSQIQKMIQSAATGGMGGGGGFDISSLLSGLGGGSGGSIFSGAGSGYGASGGALPSFPKINIALPSSSAGLPGF